MRPLTRLATLAVDLTAAGAPNAETLRLLPQDPDPSFNDNLRGRLKQRLETSLQQLPQP